MATSRFNFFLCRAEKTLSTTKRLRFHRRIHDFFMDITSWMSLLRTFIFNGSIRTSHKKESSFYERRPDSKLAMWSSSSYPCHNSRVTASIRVEGTEEFGGKMIPFLTTALTGLDLGNQVDWLWDGQEICSTFPVQSRTRSISIDLSSSHIQLVTLHSRKRKNRKKSKDPRKATAKNTFRR